MFRSLLLLVFLLAVPLVKADPVTFDFGSVVALQNGGNSSINLNTPNVLLAPTSIDPITGVRSLNVAFDLTVDAGQTWAGVVRYDWVLNGISSTTFNNNCLNGCTSQFVHGVGSFLDYTTPFFFTTPGSVTISVINDSNQIIGSHTFSFAIAEPVPEPASFLLLGNGLTLLVCCRKALLRRNKKSRYEARAVDS